MSVVAQIQADGRCQLFPEQEKAALSHQFDQNHFLKLQDFFDRAITAQLMKHLQQATFVRREHPGIGVEECMEENSLDGLLHLALNDLKLFQKLEHLTGCATIGSFRGRMYRFMPDQDHYDSWHSDIAPEDNSRVLALSINFNDAPYSGGALQIRECESEKIVAEVENSTCGDAVLFRLREDLEHRVTPVTGEVPRTVFAGWFKTTPNIVEYVANKIELLEMCGKGGRGCEPTSPPDPQIGSVNQFRTKDGVFERLVGKDLFLVNIATLKSCRVNEIGQQIWRGLKERKTLRALQDEIASEFDAPPDLVASDLQLFVTELLATGMIGESRVPRK
jgi:hypothetical protein